VAAQDEATAQPSFAAEFLKPRALARTEFLGQGDQGRKLLGREA
jgi:hypothetical protein